MKKLSISNSEIRLIVILLSIVFLACAYFFGLNKGLQDAELIQAECDTIQADIDRLNGMVAKRTAIENETKSVLEKKEDIIAKYPVSRPIEKVIYEIRMLSDSTEVHFSNIGFTMDQKIASKNEGINGYNNTVRLAYEGGYDELKTLFDYIRDCDDRMTLTNVTMDYDMELGEFAGALQLNLYYMTGTEKEYEEIPPLWQDFGMENIFEGNPNPTKHPMNTIELVEYNN